jgi:hypothetical protein
MTRAGVRGPSHAEHDEHGDLLWLLVLVSTSRQVGKSWLLRELALWRTHQADRWGEPQLSLSSKDVSAAAEIHRPARLWARTQPGWGVRQANGEQEVRHPDGSRWVMRGQPSVYSYSASFGSDVPPRSHAPEHLVAGGQVDGRPLTGSNVRNAPRLDPCTARGPTGLG